MPKAWSGKDERQYDHVKQSELDRGVGVDRAEEIAARTVNKERREEDRTPGKRTQGTGDPHKAPDELSRDELYNRAREQGVAGRSRMSKAQLVEALK